MKYCIICNTPLTYWRQTKYCSTPCRNRFHNQKHKQYNYEWQVKRRASLATKSDKKLQCLFCGLWYIQVGSHVVYAHKQLAREYKIHFDLPLKAGVVPEWYKKLKGDMVFENGTVENLKKGIRMRYKMGDPRAREVTGWKGRHGKIGYKEFMERYV